MSQASDNKGDVQTQPQNPLAVFDRLDRASEVQTVPMNSTMGLYLNPVLFEQGMRAAGVLATSGILPAHYSGNQSACFLLLAMSSALNMNPIMLAQRSYIVHGKFALEGQAMIALANNSGKYSEPLMWDYRGSGPNREITCRAIRTNGVIVQADCSVQMAKDFGWWDKKDSMWPRMTDQMLAYRSAAFLLRRYTPEVLLGLSTVDEVADTGGAVDATFSEVPSLKISTVEHDTSAFESAIASRGGDLKDKHLAEFITQIAEQNRMPVNQVKAEAAKDMDNFVKSFQSWAAQASQAEQPQMEQSQQSKRPTKEEMEAKRYAAKAAWLATGKPLDEAEKAVNAFAHSWNSAQCSKVEDMAAAASITAPADGVKIFCEDRGAEVDTRHCFNECQKREGCPSWA